MKSLISPLEVHRYAFAGGQCLPSDAVTEADIITAEERFLRPVFGAALLDAVRAGQYADFLTDYLVCCLALLTRVVLQPQLDLQTTPIGTLAPKGTNGTAADTAELRRLQQNLRHRAQTLLKRASEYVEAHAEAFPEYDSRANILNRCTTYGGFVQVH